MSAKPQLFSYLLVNRSVNHLKIVTFFEREGRKLLVNIEGGCVPFLYCCFEYISIFATNNSFSGTFKFTLSHTIHSRCLAYFIK